MNAKVLGVTYALKLTHINWEMFRLAPVEM